eukprot:409080-Hanusia_phi.AAC.1
MRGAEVSEDREAGGGAETGRDEQEEEQRQERMSRYVGGKTFAHKRNASMGGSEGLRGESVCEYGWQRYVCIECRGRAYASMGRNSLTVKICGEGAYASMAGPITVQEIPGTYAGTWLLRDEEGARMQQRHRTFCSLGGGGAVCCNGQSGRTARALRVQDSRLVLKAGTYPAMERSAVEYKRRVQAAQVKLDPLRVQQAEKLVYVLHDRYVPLLRSVRQLVQGSDMNSVGPVFPPSASDRSHGTEVTAGLLLSPYSRNPMHVCMVCGSRTRGPCL